MKNAGQEKKRKLDNTILEEIAFFLQSKSYLMILLLTAAGAYGFAITHYSIGMDDTAISLYFEEGLAAYVGRWTLFVLNRVFQVKLGDFVPWLTEFVSVIILMLSATMWCVLWKRAVGEAVSLPKWCYGVVAGVLLSCPLISEVYVFYLHNGVCTGYGLTAIALICLMNSVGEENRRTSLKQALFAGVFLWIALGFYESFLICYLVGAITVFFLRILFRQANTELPAWIGFGSLSVLAALALRTITLFFLKKVYRLDELSGYNVLYRKLFGEIFTTPNEFQMVVKRFVMKYYINALTYFPITVLVAALIVIGLTALFAGGKRKIPLLLFCFLGIVFLPFFMSLVEGLATRYRSAQYVPVVSAFGVLLLFLMFYRRTRSGWGYVVALSLSGILLFDQCQEMNQWFYVDYLKYEDTRRVMETIAHDLQSDYNLSKPVIFRGAYQVPYEIAKYAYTGFDTWQYALLCTLTNPVDPHLKEKYYAQDAPAYVSPEMPLISTLQWGVTAFDGTCGQLIRFWNMCGIDGIFCETDLAKIAEAEELRTRDEMPSYPCPGYIKEYEEYIIINM